ncbi:MAG TPA: hypothetical protein VID28_02760 [Methylomirabilota bacterium]|jgi:hypothetical protein
MGLKVLDPRLDAEGEAMTLATPLRSLEGATIGLLDNAKIGTAVLFDHVQRILTSRFGVREFIRRRKPDSSRPAPPEILGELSAADAVISAIGD